MPNIHRTLKLVNKPKLFDVRSRVVKCIEHFIEHFNMPNRPFSYSENECGSNDISLQFVEFSNVHNCDGSSNGTQSSLVYKIV